MNHLLKFNIVLLFWGMSAHGQFSTKLPSIKLSMHPPTDCVVYELPDIWLYFNKTDVVAILRNDSLAYHDAADSALLKQLQLHPKNSFVVKSTDTVYNRKTGFYIETNYEWATKRLLTYLLYGGNKFSIYDIGNKQYIKKIFIRLYDFDADIKGEYVMYDIYSPLGKVIYNHRARNMECDFLMNKKWF